MTHRSVIVWVVILTALMGQYGSSPSTHHISIVSCSGDFKFYADELPDGTHTYKTSFIWENGWLLEPQFESGRLSENDWRTLKSLRRCEGVPQAAETDLQDPNEIWGVMERGGETIDIRYAEWRKLATTQVPASLHSMVFKAKASL